MSGEERNFTDIYKTIEAILFATGDPVAYERLGMLLELTPGQVKSIALDMAEGYTDRGIQLLCYDTACQLCTKEQYEDIIKDALGIKKNGALSKSSLETLAIIAYNQPVTRTYVEEVRGVDSAYAFGVLLQRELIEVRGRLDVPGRPNLYATTKKFLRVFGLSSLNELPSVDALSIKDEVADTVNGEAKEEDTGTTEE
ncbi:MAG: SMC-Scp complex subunit ScpB [Ruminococcaceae bacterium]|nr:SMC-Scp complex subunit ScpB [Oscillospiraceae bacterium]